MVFRHGGHPMVRPWSGHGNLAAKPHGPPVSPVVTSRAITAQEGASWPGSSGNLFLAEFHFALREYLTAAHYYWEAWRTAGGPSAAPEFLFEPMKIPQNDCL